MALIPLLLAPLMTLAAGSRPGSEPSLIGAGVVSTRQGEYSPSYDVQRGELYFMRRTPGRFDYTIVVSSRDEDGWSEPRTASFSGNFRDGAPYLSSDGRTIYFDSSRPASDLETDSINLWRSRRGSAGWSIPELLRVASDNPVQSDRVGRDEFGPAVDSRGRLHFYSFRSPHRNGSRFVSDGDAGIREERAIPDPSAPTFVSYLQFSADGTTAVMDGRAPGRSDTDLYYACLGEAGWSEALPLVAANSSSGEQGPWLTSDGATLMFSSDRPAADPDLGPSNLYWMSTASLPIPCSERAEP